IFVRDNFISLDTVRGSSMAPSLSPHAHERGELDRVFIKRGISTKSVERGDVITFWKPHKADEISIKRVVGLEGDTVFPHRGFAVDGEGAVVVPAGHVWVEGDNSRRSYDSCDFGPVSKALIDGKATKV
ncbi:peptidase S24/S26A/S26B/S26C, partial [Lophiotrema nucula]